MSQSSTPQLKNPRLHLKTLSFNKFSNLLTST